MCCGVKTWEVRQVWGVVWCRVWHGLVWSPQCRMVCHVTAFYWKVKRDLAWTGVMVKELHWPSRAEQNNVINVLAFITRLTAPRDSHHIIEAQLLDSLLGHARASPELTHVTVFVFSIFHTVVILISLLWFKFFNIF